MYFSIAYENLYKHRKKRYKNYVQYHMVVPAHTISQNSLKVVQKNKSIKKSKCIWSLINQFKMSSKKEYAY